MTGERGSYARSNDSAAEAFSRDWFFLEKSEVAIGW
jgi:hypothetical protein